MSKTYGRTDTGELYIDEGGQRRALLKDNGAIITDAMIALAILVDALGDSDRAEKLYSRFNWRVIKELPKGAWKIPLERVSEAVADIEKVHRETAMSRAMVAREPPPIVNDRGSKALGIEWDMEHK